MSYKTVDGVGSKRMKSISCNDVASRPQDEDGKVVDSVPEFPYACAIQYRQVRGQALLPGSEWDRV